MIGGPVGFPGGGHTTDTKVQEVRQLIADGAREVDMVVNIGKVLSGDYDYVREDLRRVVEAAAPVPAKVILETHYLNEEQIRRVCEIAVEVGMKWVKTSTGWAPTGATVEKVRIIADQLKGRIDIKGAGGIRDPLSLKHGACVADIMLAETKRGMVEHASQVIIVCDYSKLNNTSLAQFTAADRIDTVVVDRLPDDVQAYRNAGIQVISLDEENLL